MKHEPEPDRATVRESLRKAFPPKGYDCEACARKTRRPLMTASGAVYCSTECVPHSVEATTVEPDYAEADAVEREMVWSPVMGCWTVGRWGMTIGIEVDGYVHS